MNVLLAEADVPYPPALRDGAGSTRSSPARDVVLVVGANDVTNPAARTSPESPIYGMPILEVDRAKQVIVLSARSARASRASTTRSTTSRTARCCSATPRHP